MKTLVIYHKEDNDGVLSAAIILNYLMSEMNVARENIEMWGTEYNELATFWRNNKGTDAIKEWASQYNAVVMTDVSFDSADAMLYMKNRFGSAFTWIDHHGAVIRTSIENKFDDVNGNRDTTRSAILNAYKYFYDPFDLDYNAHTCPAIYQVLSDWDCWAWYSKDMDEDWIRSVNTGFTKKSELNVDWYLENVVRNVNFTIANAYDYGSMFVRIDKERFATLIKNYGDMNWTVDNMRPACALFIQEGTNSAVFATVKDKVSNGIVFKHNIDSSWTISLYNTDNQTDFHCGDYLKKTYGGGGHTGAAGCTVQEATFIKILKNKNI